MIETELHQITRHPRNERVTFDAESHTYTLDGKQVSGVTKWLSSFGKGFNSMKVAKKLTSYHPKYRHLEPQDLLDIWQEAQDYGNVLHDMVQYSVNDGLESNMVESSNMKAVLELYGLTPLFSEWVIFDERISMASAIDLICLNQKGQLVIVDLKTMEKDIEVDAYEDVKMSIPVQNLPDSKYYKYCLQVSLYYKWLTELYGLDVCEDLFILHMNGERCELIKAENLQKEITKLYDYAK